MAVKPMVTYASSVWWPKNETMTVVNTLGRVQGLACLEIAVAMRTTPTVALRTLMNTSCSEHILSNSKIGKKTDHFD